MGDHLGGQYVCHPTLPGVLCLGSYQALHVSGHAPMIPGINIILVGGTNIPAMDDRCCVCLWLSK